MKRLPPQAEQKSSPVLSMSALVHPAPLGSGVGDALYDLDTFLFREPTDHAPVEHDGAVSYTGTIFHELSHWIQHHGTSIGCLLSLIRYSQHKTILGQRRQVPPYQWKSAVEKRRQGIPLVPLREVALARDLLGDTAEYINTVRQMWFDHLIAYATILELNANGASGLALWGDLWGHHVRRSGPVF